MTILEKYGKTINLTYMIYFTSDTHYNHKNLVKGISRWEDKSGCRDFNTKEEMNDLLVENINKVVKPDDVLFHLGDFAFHGKHFIKEFREKINCKNVHLIYGNHDPDIYDDPEIQSIFSSVAFYREISINGQKIMLMHYPLRTWNQWHHGSWMLYGHCHGKLQHQIPSQLLKQLIDEKRWDDLYALADGKEVEGLCPNGRSMDVGIDTHPQFRPYSISEIHEIMEKKSFTAADDHI
jgi:calcineurin-like phosphoesterase family protein